MQLLYGENNIKFGTKMGEPPANNVCPRLRFELNECECECIHLLNEYSKPCIYKSIYFNICAVNNMVKRVDKYADLRIIPIVTSFFFCF